MTVARRIGLIVGLIALVAGCQRGEKPIAKATAEKSPKKGEVSTAAHESTTESSAVRKADFVTSSAESTQDSPERLVKKFVSALRAGDARTVSNLLTDKARHETRRHGLEVRPQLFPDTSFEIQETQFASERKDVAYVGCKWKEPNSEAEAFEIVWITKRHEQGWRVSGFATPVMEGEGTKVLNFENVVDMLSVMESASGDSDTTSNAKSSN
jgi:hypothetical protein